MLKSHCFAPFVVAMVCLFGAVAAEAVAGEVGFSSFRLTDKTPTRFYAPYTEAMQAAMLVRMFVLQLSAGVDKIFWYDFLNDGWETHNPEHNFGLIRRDLLPLLERSRHP